MTPIIVAGEIVGWMLMRRPIHDEIVEDTGATTIADAGAQDLMQEKRSYEPPVPSLAQVIKRSCQLREAGDDRWESVFDWNSVEDIFAAEWVGSLTDNQLASVRHMARWRLDEHLKTDCSGRLPSFLTFDADAYAMSVMEKDRLKQFKAAQEAHETRRAMAVYGCADPEPQFSVA